MIAAKTRDERAARAATLAARNTRRAYAVIVGFVLVQLACQVALLFPALAKFRVVFRTASFAIAIAALLLIPGRSRTHPSALFAALVLSIVGLGLFHPTTNSAAAGVAQIALYVAILGPIFWVCRLDVTAAVLGRLVLILWLFHTASAAVGVLQMHYPGRFQPALSDIIASSEFLQEVSKITLADGTQTFRPMGLTDAPGGAAGAGLYCCLFGLGFYLASRSWAVRVAAAASIVIGLFCIYMSQVRSLLVMVGVAAAVLTTVLARRGESVRLAGLAVLVPAVVLVSYKWAAAVGGESTVNRMRTLTERSASELYYANRGHFLEHTVMELLPRYPLGAGLGRWGMMHGYFGDKNAPPDRASIWVEIQWTGWLLDGGLPLIAAYTFAIAIAVRVAYVVAVRSPPGHPLAVWASVVLGYDIAAVAVTFNYPLFISQGGLEFWLLNSVLFAAATASSNGVSASVRPKKIVDRVGQRCSSNVGSAYAGNSQ
ncbi:MAG: hypothetical protein U0746_18135 [Gemmataceae bacterium]